MKVKQILATGIIATMALGGSIFMTGCDAVSGIVGDNPISNALATSKKTSSDDYNKFIAIQDPNGINYVSVIYLQQKGTTGFDAELVKSDLEKAGINWYQLIASNSMGTNQQQYGYLFLPGSTTYNDVVTAMNTLSSNFDAHICTEEEYSQYVDDKTGSMVNIDLYHNETTHFGPAAKQQQ